MARRSDYSLARPYQPQSPAVEAAKHLASEAKRFVSGKAGHWEVEEAYRRWEDAIRKERAERAERAEKQEKP